MAGFILGKYGQFNIEKSLCVIYNTERLKEKIVFQKSQCSFMLKKKVYSKPEPKNQLTLFTLDTSEFYKCLR